MFQSFPDDSRVSGVRFAGQARHRAGGGSLSRRRPADALLHTSDWHLGRTVRQRRSRDDDFDAVLAEITGDRPRRPAGPDRPLAATCSTPTGRPPSDLRRCLRALRDLSEVAPVVVVAGNHDSPVLLEALDFAVTAFGGRRRRRRRAPAEVRRPGPASPRRRDPGLPGPRRASSGSGWPRCRSSTRTGSWTSFTSPAHRHPRLRPAPARGAGRAASAGCSTATSRTGTSWSSPRTCTSRARSPPTPSGPSRSATPT